MRRSAGLLLFGVSLAAAGCSSNSLLHGDAAAGTGGGAAGTGGTSGTGGAAHHGGTSGGGGSVGAGGSAGTGGAGGSSSGAGGRAGAPGAVDAAVDSGVDAQTVCGSRVCAAGTYCCNPSCGICAPLGTACIQVLCPPDAQLSFDALSCVVDPGLDSTCVGARPPHAYRCILTQLPAPCVPIQIGNVTNIYCCP